MLLLPATVTLAEARDTLRMLQQSLEGDSGALEIAVDASQLSAFDSSTLAVLLECRRLAATANRPFAVRGAPAHLTNLARLYGVDELLGMTPAAG